MEEFKPPALAVPPLLSVNGAADPQAGQFQRPEPRDAPLSWMNDVSYASAWETCRMLDEQRFMMEQGVGGAGGLDESVLVWDTKAEPGSTAENGMLIGMAMSLATTTIDSLTGAIVLRADAEALGVDISDVSLKQLQEVTRKELPVGAMYLDVTAPLGRVTTVALQLGADEQRWLLTGAYVRQVAHCLIVVPFGYAPALDEANQPASQPLVRLVIGPPDELPDPSPGDIMLPTDGSPAMTPVVEHPESRVTWHLRGAYQLALAAVAVVHRLLDEDVEVYSAASRQQRREAERGNVQIPLQTRLKPASDAAE